MNKKGLVIDKEKYDTYQFLLEKVIVDKMSPNELAWELNRKGIPSPRGGK